MSVRELVFRDDQSHQKKFAMGDQDYLKFTTAFQKFLRKYLSEDNTTLRIERVLTGEVLVIETAVGIIGRMRGGAQPEATYRRKERRDDTDTLAVVFARDGYAALDDYGPFVPDRDSLLPDEQFENLDLQWKRDWDDYEAKRAEVRKMPKLDRKLLNRFCQAWADHGYVEEAGSSEQYYVLFDSRTLEAAGTARDELITVITDLGLELVDTPEGSSSGEIWVRADPRVDLELEKWG